MTSSRAVLGDDSPNGRSGLPLPLTCRTRVQQTNIKPSPTPHLGEGEGGNGMQKKFTLQSVWGIFIFKVWPGRWKLLIVCFYSQMCLRGTCTHRVAPTQGRKKWANIRTRSARGSDICWMQLPRVGWLSKVARLPAFYDKLPDSSDCFCHFYPLKGTAAQRCSDLCVQIMPF